MADLGSNDTTYHVRTHLGHLLNAGDTALGYDLTRANFVDDELENFLQKGHTLPDVVLVSYTMSIKLKQIIETQHFDATYRQNPLKML